MNQRFATLALALAAVAASGSAMAQTDASLQGWGAVQSTDASGKTRAEVRAETLQALHNGDVIAAGELGLTERQLAHGRAAETGNTTVTRAEVKRELADSRNGQVIAGSYYRY